MAIVVKSDFWGNNYSPIDQSNSLNEQVRRIFAKPGLRREKALLNALIGAVAGGTALATTVQVEADTNDNSGKRTIETVTVINRATTAADVTELKAGINYNPVISTPVDRSKRA